jgi:hypothetical protein
MREGGTDLCTLSNDGVTAALDIALRFLDAFNKPKENVQCEYIMA